MAESPRQWQQINGGLADTLDGDCEAAPVPALWYQDDEDLLADSGIVNRFWLPLAIAVVAGWGGITYVLVNSFGWMVILAIAGVVLAGSVAAVALVRTGDSEPIDLPKLKSEPEREEHSWQNAA